MSIEEKLQVTSCKDKKVNSEQYLESVHKVKVCHPRAGPGDLEHLENTGFPIKDFGNDRLKNRVFINRH
jgi:hypothetical protein